MYFKKNIIITSEENISQEFRLNKRDEKKNDFIEEINQNELMSKKYDKFVKFRIILSTYIFYFLQLLDVFPFLLLLL